MKKVFFMKHIIFSVLILGLFSACEGVLNEEPISTFPDSKFWLTNDDANTGVTAVYDAMQKTYNQKHFLWGELRADNYDPAGSATGGSLELMKNNLQPNNAGVSNWAAFYNMIARANLAIQKIPTIPNFDKNIYAEALMLRAYAYFDGVRVWGALPLFTEPITSLNQEILKPKTDGAKIMADIVVKDMLEAEKLMTTNTNQYRFSKASIWAFQAEVYMFLKDYTKAKVALDKIVALKAFTLANTRETWAKMFFNNSTLTKTMAGPELIFSLRFELTEDSDRSGIYAIFFAGLPNYYVSKKLENLWLNKFPTDSTLWKTKYPTFTPKTVGTDGKPIYGDWRYIETKEQGPAIGLSRVAKYNKTNYSPAFDNTDIHIYRYADMLLLLAEAENQLNNSTVALGLLNQVRDARQLPRVAATEFTNKAQLENIILDERQMELVAEGKRWWDLIRTGKAVEVMGPINGQTDKKLLFPIFQQHLIENPLLTQTPGYE